MVRGVPLANPFVHNLQGRRLLRSGGAVHLPTKLAEAGVFIPHSVSPNRLADFVRQLGAFFAKKTKKKL